MKAQVRVGDVEVAVTGMKLTIKDVRSLMRSAASIAVAITPQSAEPAAPIGFSVITERASINGIEPEYYEDE